MGFMGSGKSTVGSLLAERLGWTAVDVDREVEREAGRSVPELFREEGEEAFRRREHAAALRALARDEVVVAPGGGWPCREGRLEGVGSDTLTVWLRVSAERAVERARAEGDTRPLLAGPDPLRRAAELLAEREPWYRKAEWHVDTDRRGPEEVAGLLWEGLTRDPAAPLRE